jgi:hypothetical protein
VYRKLHGVERDENFHETVKRFIKMTTGKQYSISFSSFVRDDLSQEIQPIE